MSGATEVNAGSSHPLLLPSSSTNPDQNGVRKRGKLAREKREANARLHVLDSHMRLNFLHQAALHMSFQSSGLNDGFAKLSRRYAKLFRDVHKTERVKVMPDVMQTFCKKCKQLFIAKVERCELTVIQRKVLQRKCLLCGYCKNYELNRDYLSRNEKFWKEQESMLAEDPKSS
ncbi:RNAse P Rpr2/Rpp21 subunit domain protein [Ancylostoma caninum]|uniref:RNAse P Rpr2/Rpp21 subunit domain protein n=1 Tax=Ancylostoma caninum TaxID=29170 RepID=A0A368FM06_ANCCA|nr:RNAse P Rpr2/Rpp21 subunit domain protein [Ancylostoma caninum]